MKNKTTCDRCKCIDESENMFWANVDFDTEKQERVAEKMAAKNQDAVCEDCFNEMVEEAK